jgi:hypothetical protein
LLRNDSGVSAPRSRRHLALDASPMSYVGQRVCSEMMIEGGKDMDIALKSSRALVAVAVLSTALSACARSSGPTAPSMSQPSSKTLSQTNGTLAATSSVNGAAGQMPAYYEGRLFTVNMKEMPSSDTLIEKNKSINEIYASNDLDEEQDFIPVLDAIQGEGFNPLWRQILIVFNPGFAPHQFVSEAEIDAAAAATPPEITLVETDEVYRCSVVGRK